MTITKHDLFSNTLYKQNDVMSGWLLLMLISELHTTKVGPQGPRGGGGGPGGGGGGAGGGRQTPGPGL